MRRRKTFRNSSRGRMVRFGYGLYPSEECNIAGCPWGRLQGLHSSLGAFALLHSSFVSLNCKISCHVAKVFQMKSATLQAVLEEGCRFCILLWVPLHCCILLFLPDATPCASFFNRVKQGKPAEKGKPARRYLPCENEDYNLHYYILPFLPRQFARKCPVSHSFSEGRHIPV